MMKWLAALLTAASSFAVSATPGDPVKVVYHMNEDVARAPQALRNVRNHLSVDPKAKIVTYVPSGVAEVSRLQIQEGYAYLKP